MIDPTIRTPDYRWLPNDDATVRAAHSDLDLKVFSDAAVAAPRSPACRCVAVSLRTMRPLTRYPKRWSRAKRKASRAAALSVWSRLVRGAP